MRNNRKFSIKAKGKSEKEEKTDSKGAKNKDKGDSFENESFVNLFLIIAVFTGLIFGLYFYDAKSGILEIFAQKLMDLI